MAPPGEMCMLGGFLLSFVLWTEVEGAPRIQELESSWFIERAADGESSLGDDMGIDHGAPQVVVPQQFLNRAYVVPLFQEAGSEGVAEGMAAPVLWYA